MSRSLRLILAGVVIGGAAAGVAPGCANRPVQETATTVRVGDPGGKVARWAAGEFPVGMTRERVRARATELGMSRRPTTTLWVEGGMPERREVEGGFVDVFEVSDGAAAACAEGSGVKFIGMLFTDDDRLREVLLDVDAPPSGAVGEGVMFGFAGGMR